MGIKSFQGSRRAQQSQETEVNLKVSDYMSTELITFFPEQSVSEVIEKLIQYRISGAPVVDHEHRLIGVISEGDCLKQVSDSRYYNMPVGQSNVESHMAKNVETIDGNMNIFDAANKFLNSKEGVSLL